MNRDIHPELGPKERLGDFDAVVAAVRSIWPSAYAEGSTGAERSWWVRDGAVGTNLVAHSWPVRGNNAMWLRLRRS